MKKNLLIAFALIISLMACKKEKPAEPVIEERKPEVLIKNITEKLAAADSISTFTEALKSINLTVEETAQGITVFAPLNESAGVPGRLGKVSSHGNTTGARSVNPIAETSNVPQQGLTDSVLRDHIVKGVFKLTDLTDGKVLTGLSGKQLKVSRSADTIWINGVQVGGKEILNTNNEVVYTVKSTLTATTVTDELQSTSIEVTVWDGTLWASTKPKGEVLAGATVTLYRTQQNYADSLAAYSTTSDASGKALFKSITPGTYYIKVAAGAKSNIFNRSDKQGGLYSGFASAGIFQTQTEITAAPAQTGAQPGDFKWIDTNGDGVVNNNDRVTLPYEHAAATNGALKKIEISIGLLKNKQSLFTEQEFLTGMANAENNVASWQKTLAIADGLLSHQAVIDSIPLVFKANYQSFGLFAFTPTNPGITQIWQQGYAQIATLNALQEKAPAAMAKRAEKMSQLKAIRAYVYLQLLTYFGNIPLLQNPANLTNTNRAAVYNFITTELESAADSLSLAAAGAANLNGLSVKVLIAKAALLEKDYAKVSNLTNDVINSAQYSLASLGSQFNAGNAELIWNNSANIDVNVKNYFFNRSILPYLRLTEVYLMSAEAHLALNNTSNAQARYAALLQRSSLPVQAVNQANLRTLWTSEMRREGVAFVNLIRWETAANELARYGFAAGKHNRLPIPQLVIDQNPGMVQNPGY